VDVDGWRRVLHVRRLKAIEIPLFDAAALNGDLPADVGQGLVWCSARPMVSDSAYITPFGASAMSSARNVAA
jgi:hypothetical protein